MARGQKGWQKTTAGAFWFSLVVAGLLVAACLVVGTLDFLLFNQKPSSSFVGHFHWCHDHLDCTMEDWVIAPEVTEISPAVEPVVTNIFPGVRICLISQDGTCSDLPQVVEISPPSPPSPPPPPSEPVLYDISPPDIRICLLAPGEDTCVEQASLHGVVDTPYPNRFLSSSAGKGTKRVFGALSTTPQTPVSGESRKRPSTSEMLLSSQSGGSIRDGALKPTQSRIRDRGEMESGGPDDTGQAHRSTPATRTLVTAFADMDVLSVTPTDPVAPKTRKVSCCKVRFPPPIVNHILISFFCCN